MSRVHLSRVLVGGLLALVCVLTGLVSPVAPAPDGTSLGTPELEVAADTSMFRAGNIISDAVFYDSASMSVGQIQSFLNAKGASCRPAADGTACLKDYVIATPTRAADRFCTRQYDGSGGESAATIIAKVGVACGINPRVLLVTLQKEMGLVTTSSPTAKSYTRAMGYGCPDTTGGTCDSTYNGLFNQLYTAAKQFQRYAANPTGYGHAPRMNNYVRWHPNSACGSSVVYIENQATASLYNYTPYQPNAAALAAGYGAASDGCSSYGNRNFWNYFTDWFGSTQTLGRDVDAPGGTLDSAVGGPGKVTVGGWTFDPNALTTPLGVHFYTDGVFAGALTADQWRPDIGAAFPTAGAAHGYLGTFQAPEGVHTICAYAINVGAGYTNTLLGCQTINVGPPPNPVGNMDVLKVSGRTLTVGGWTFDPDALGSPVAVHLYVNGQWGTALTADAWRPDIAAAFPAAGGVHGWNWSLDLGGPGSYQVCAYAINQGEGTTNPQVGCLTATVDASSWNPLGSIDWAGLSGRTVTLTGWALDADTPTTATAIHAYVDGRWGGAYEAGTYRPDVGAAFPGFGDQHGFQIPIDLPGGTHQVCLYLINSGYGSMNPSLGCRTVTVDPAAWNPFGNLEWAASDGTTATLGGWVIDPDVQTSGVMLHVYVDGIWRTEVRATDSRPDVGAAFPAAGANHGFTTGVVVGPGRHQVCVYSINVGLGTTNPLMGCRTVG
ncbi:hypothetical protein [Blastococcus litoris]|uniref:hypothetical protein n=1 Tax=Blastococcus litoris TaxID=2171622 RepID=UPI000E30522B|nr:hypothetical protein [Blastococcus litoris]